MNMWQAATDVRKNQLEFWLEKPLLYHLQCFILGIFILAIGYQATWLGLLRKYATSGTYAHGFLVFPLAIWMISQKRHFFSELKVQFEPKALVLLLFLGAAWAIAGVALVTIVQQLCVILMLISLFILCFGGAIACAYIFPLCYLFFAIPFGNFLTPTLQDLTAHFAVIALELSGVPVFFEGWQISTSSGDFEVAEACSGIRYLIASLALGVLFAYITYEKPFKRLIFCTACLIVPLVANGVRAYIIIMIAHFSKMKYAVGVDHLIYGWIFFGVIIFGLFSLGSIWRDKPSKPHPIEMNSTSTSSPIHRNWMMLLMVPLMVLAPVGMIFHWQGTHKLAQISIAWPSHPQFEWERLTQVHEWLPTFKGPHIERKGHFAVGQKTVDVYLAIYGKQTKESELISEDNHFFSRRNWSILSRQKLLVGETPVVEHHVQNRHKKRLVWHTYSIGGIVTPHDILGKILEGYRFIKMHHAPSGVLVLSCEYEYYPEDARQALEQFMEQMGASMLKELFQDEA